MIYEPCEFQLPSGLILRGFSHVPESESKLKTNEASYSETTPETTSETTSETTPESYSETTPESSPKTTPESYSETTLESSPKTEQESYLESNPQTKPVVLCLHGWLDNAASFLPLWDSLFTMPKRDLNNSSQQDLDKSSEVDLDISSQQDLNTPSEVGLNTSAQQGLDTLCQQGLHTYTWYSVDFPGHGLSDHRGTDAAYHHTDYILDIAALIETQGWENVILVGHSMGGIVGASVCALLPERIQHFISIEALGPLVEEPTMTVQQMRKAMHSRIEQAQKTIKQPDSLSRILNAKMKAGKISEEHAEMIMLRNLREAQGRFVWGTDPKLRTVSTFRMTQDQAKDIMQNIRCPILFIKGDNGFVRIAEQYAERSPWLTTRHKLVTLSGNHYVHMQVPQDLLAAIKEYLED